MPVKPKQKTTKKPVRKQRGGNCTRYSNISDVFTKPMNIVTEVKSVVADTVANTAPMTETQAAKTVSTVVDTVKEVAPEVPTNDIQDAVIEAISENNVQQGGKRLRKTYVKAKTTKRK